jgi:hypothetical protein
VKTVLVIEDETPIRENIIETLTYEDFATLQAENGLIGPIRPTDELLNAIHSRLAKHATAASKYKTNVKIRPESTVTQASPEPASRHRLLVRYERCVYCHAFSARRQFAHQT